MTRQAMTLALEALKETMKRTDLPGVKFYGQSMVLDKSKTAIRTLEAELNKPEQKPVAWTSGKGKDWLIRLERPSKRLSAFLEWQPLYTAPPDLTKRIKELEAEIERLSLDLAEYRR